MFEPVFAALAERNLRYLVAGGVAVVLHGYARVTLDLDLIVDDGPGQARAAIGALTGLGLRPRLPVDPFQFADPEARAAWVSDGGLVGFTLNDPGNPYLLVDLFVQPPSDFEGLWGRARHIHLDALDVPVVSLDDLIAMKEAAGRPMDQLDVAELKAIRDLQ